MLDDVAGGGVEHEVVLGVVAVAKEPDRLDSERAGSNLRVFEKTENLQNTTGERCKIERAHVAEQAEMLSLASRVSYESVKCDLVRGLVV